jgi:hypothetical protein
MSKDVTVTYRTTSKKREWLRNLGHGNLNAGLDRCLEYRHICHIFGVEIDELYRILDKARDNNEISNHIDDTK